LISTQKYQEAITLSTTLLNLCLEGLRYYQT
jgi:hypothetical protein